jgi:hypothetical protein
MLALSLGSTTLGRKARDRLANFGGRRWLRPGSLTIQFGVPVSGNSNGLLQSPLWMGALPSWGRGNADPCHS